MNNRDINVIVGDMPTRLMLGRRGENLAVHINFNLAQLIEQYGDGVPELLHLRKGDTGPYPVLLERSETIATWNVSAADTAVSGLGSVEMRWYVGDVLAKSMRYDAIVASAMPDTQTEPPEAQQGWVDSVLQTAVQTALNAENAASSAESADNAKNAAEAAKNVADECATDAETARGEAITAKNDAVTAAQDAADSATAAATSETNVLAAEQNTSDSATRAQTSETNAAASASLAAESAANAAESATAAATTMQNISDSAAQIVTNTADISQLKETLVDNYPKLESKNLIDLEKVTVGGYVNSNGGVISQSNTRSYTEYIEVSQNTEYTLTSYDVSAGIYTYAFYDSDKNYLSSTYNPSAAGNTSITFTTPDNCKYIRCTLGITYKDKYQLEIGTISTAYSKYNKLIPEKYIPIKEIVNNQLQKHRLLVVNPSGANYFCNIATENAFNGGYLVEGCSIDGFVLNADKWKDTIDAVVFYDLVIKELVNSVTADDAVSAIKKYWSNGVKFIFTKFGGGDITTYKKDGTKSTTSIRNNLFGGGISVSSSSSVTNATFTQQDTPVMFDILKSGIGKSSTVYGYSWSTGYTYYSPVVAIDDSGAVCNCTLYNPNGVFLMNYGGLLANDNIASPTSQYIKLDKVLDEMLGVKDSFKLSLDRLYGKKIAAYGIDGDVTEEPETYQRILNNLGSKRTVGVSLRSKLMTNDLADIYKNLDGNYSLVSHTASHYTDRTTYENEEYIVGECGIVKLNHNVKAVIDKVIDSENNEFTFKSNMWYIYIPTGADYFADYTTTSPIELNYGILRFPLEKIGTTVKISYSALTDESGEILGSLEELKHKHGALTDKAVYMTIGSNGVHPFTRIMAEKEDIVLCDQFNGVDSKRMDFWLQKIHDKLVYPVSPTTQTNDMSLFKLSYDDAVNQINTSISYCMENHLPFEWYDHDICLAKNYHTSVFNNETGAWDSCWQKDTYEETVEAVSALYKYFYDSIDTNDAIWITREDYCRFYSILNKDLSYGCSKSENEYSLVCENHGNKKIKGLTFRIELAEEPSKVLINDLESTNYQYLDGELYVWFDMKPSDKVSVIIK